MRVLRIRGLGSLGSVPMDGAWIASALLSSFTYSITDGLSRDSWTVYLFILHHHRKRIVGVKDVPWKEKWAFTAGSTLLINHWRSYISIAVMCMRRERELLYQVSLCHHCTHVFSPFISGVWGWCCKKKKICFMLWSQRDCVEWLYHLLLLFGWMWIYGDFK